MKKMLTEKKARTRSDALMAGKPIKKEDRLAEYQNLLVREKVKKHNKEKSEKGPKSTRAMTVLNIIDRKAQAENYVWLTYLSEQINARSDKYYQQAVKVFPIIDKRNKVNLGTSMLFDPENWLELKNKMSRLPTSKNEQFSQEKHEEYLVLYPQKITEGMKKIIDHMQ